MPTPTPPKNPDDYPDLTALEGCRTNGHLWKVVLQDVANNYKLTRELVGCDRCGVLRWRSK